MSLARRGITTDCRETATTKLLFRTPTSSSHATMSTKFRRWLKTLLLATAIAVVFIVFVVIPAQHGREIPDAETLAIESLAAIAVAQRKYFRSNNDEYGTFDRLRLAGFLSQQFQGDASVIQGNIFRMRVTEAGQGQHASYVVSASPIETQHSRSPASRHFCIDSISSSVRLTDGPATANTCSN